MLTQYLFQVEFIRMLVDSGLTHVEATSFVSPKWVPQMGDNSQVMSALNGMGFDQEDKVTFPVLVPNVKGLEAALKARKE